MSPLYSCQIPPAVMHLSRIRPFIVLLPPLRGGRAACCAVWSELQRRYRRHRRRRRCRRHRLCHLRSVLSPARGHGDDVEYEPGLRPRAGLTKLHVAEQLSEAGLAAHACPLSTSFPSGQLHPPDGISGHRWCPPRASADQALSQPGRAASHGRQS